MSTVYIETTIPSFYFETRTTQEIAACRDVTRRWWDLHRKDYFPFTSNAVLTELARAPHEKAAKTLGLLKGIPVLTRPPELEEVVAYYIEHRLLPSGSDGDAYHLAMASLHGMRFLLTWNCKHLANANKIRHMTVVNARLGLTTPVITTPWNLIGEAP